ncbi:MAG TPA: sigma-70 family RNA polymerase sigma factor [Candidatus Didemnitutus sp.]|nr:sigma-70 family RNA polymerase sigma factor [Candidatus Didemnitutus sp.]
MEPDEELMRQLGGGRDTALNVLMERWQLPLRRFLYRYTQNEAEALDLAQEAFVRVYRNRSQFNPGMRFSTWLFTIGVNLCRNRARWWRRHPGESLDGLPPGEIEAAAGLRDENDPAGRLGAKEKAAAVRQAVERLPHDLRVVTLLFEFEELSQAAIAAALGCSAKAVEVRLYRARKLLRKSLGPLLEENPRG